MAFKTLTPTHIYAKVQEGYALAATTPPSNEYGTTVAKAFGYSEDELAHTPQEANLGLSCGNPFVMARIGEGETVIDLGSGAGFDVFLAAKKVGSRGKVYGVDRNKAMLTKANHNKLTTNASNTIFIESPITHIPLPDEIADCVISNCVINLVPEVEKPLVFREIYRLLKPGGRVAISDILLKRELPEALRGDMALYIGCVAGASLVEGYERYLREAGFSDILIVDAKSDLNIYKTAKGAPGSGSGCAALSSDACCSGTPSSGCCSGTNGTSEVKTKAEDIDGEGIEHLDLNAWAGSFKIYAVKS